MVHAKNYKTTSTFVKVMQKKTLASFSGHGVDTGLQPVTVVMGWVGSGRVESVKNYQCPTLGGSRPIALQ